MYLSLRPFGVALVVTGLFLTDSLSAISFGTDITIPDNDTASGPGHYEAWWNTNTEDNEVEPWTSTGQKWDLEGWKVNPATGVLSAIGGFNLRDGFGGFRSGDVFVDVAPVNARYGLPDDATSQSTGNAAHRWDYVFDIHWDGLAAGATSVPFTLYSLLENDTVTFAGVAYGQNSASNPWRYLSGGSSVASGTISLLGYGPGGPLSDADTGYGHLGSDGSAGNAPSADHYAMQLDLSGAGIPAEFLQQDSLFKFTMECGNDNLIGKMPQLPEGGSTLLLLGMGLMGLLFRKARFHRSNR